MQKTHKFIYSNAKFIYITKEGDKMVQARCMKCKKQVEVKDPKEFLTKNNLKRIGGVCPTCGTKVSRIVGKA